MHAVQRTAGNAGLSNVWPVQREEGGGGLANVWPVQREEGGGGLADVWPVQREEGGGGPGGGGGLPSIKGTFNTPSHNFLEGKPIQLGGVPIDVTALEVQGTLEYESKGEGGSAGATFEPGKGPEYEAEIKKEWEDTWFKNMTGLQPSGKLGGEVGADGGNLGVGLELEGKHMDFNYDFKFVDIDEGEINFAVVEAKVPIHLYKPPPYTLSNGAKIDVTADLTLTLKLAPDKEKVAEWLTEQVGPKIAAFVASDAAMVIGAVAVIAFMCWSMFETLDEADEIPKVVDASAKRLTNYCQSFESVMHGLAPVEGDGGPEGAAAAQKIIDDAGQTVGKAIVVRMSKQQKYYDVVRKKAAADIHAKALETWANNHWWDMHINMGGGQHMLDLTLGEVLGA